MAREQSPAGKPGVGPVNLARGVMAGGQLPELSAAVVVGFLSYGVSLVLFVYVLQHLGTARTGADLSTALLL